MLKHQADLLPVTLIVALSVVDLAAYFIVDSVWVLAALWLILALPKGAVSSWNHHHHHVATFRHGWLNRGYELCLGLHTGVTSTLWTLHHTLGHHLNYLDQERDESRWKRRDGTAMGVVEYTLTVAGTAYWRGFVVGRRFPRHQRRFLIWTAVTLAILGVLLWHRPMQGLFLYALPMACTLLFTAWATYDHHTGLESPSPFEASYNIDNRWYNVVTGNLGLHTAHHYRQGVHWSQLPELHEQIRERIPKALYKRSAFELFLRDPGSAGRRERAEPVSEGQRNAADNAGAHRVP